MGLLQNIKSKAFFLSLFAFAIIILALIFGLTKWLNFYTKHDEKIEVPNLSKLSIEETRKTLEKDNLSFIVIDSASFNNKYPPKTVLEQNPEAGSFVKDGRKIYLTINPSGYRKISVPNVLNQTKRQVVIQLKSIGFRIGEQRYIPDLGKDVVRALEIDEVEVKPGDKLPKETMIDLVLGGGEGYEEKDSIQ